MTFNRIDSLKIQSSTTREFKLDGLDLGGTGVPTLIVRHAGESNPAYWNAILRQANERQTSRNRKVTASKIEDDRADDAKLIAKHVVVNWANVYEDDPKTAGAVRPCNHSPESCELLLLALAENAPDIFAALRAFVGDADNFRTVAAVNGVELGKL